MEPSTTTPILTADYAASVGDIVRVSGSHTVVLPLNVNRDATVTVMQVSDTGTATVVGSILNPTVAASVTGKYTSRTYLHLGADMWMAVGDSGVADTALSSLTSKSFTPDLVASTAATGTLTVGQLARLNCASASLARTLPTAASAGVGGLIGVRRADTSTTFTATVNAAGSDTINGSASARVVAIPETAITLVSDGVSNWSVIATDTPASTLNGTFARPSGAWSSGTAYTGMEVVTYNGSTYRAVAASTNVTPGTDATKWESWGGGGLTGTGGGAVTTTAQVAADTAMTGAFVQQWATPAASSTLTGTLAAWTVTAVDCTAGQAARTLPAANSVHAGTAYAAKKSDTSTNNLVIGVTGGDLIFGTGSGTSTKKLILPGEAVTFVSDGVSKYTVSTSDTPSSQLEARYGTLGGPLGRWRYKLGTSPSTAKIAILGDSTSEEHSAAGQLYSWMRRCGTGLGAPLYGMPTDIYTDGNVTSGSATLTSASANFTAADVGKALLARSTYFPITAVISAVTNSTTVTISTNALSTTTTLQFTVGRAILPHGYSGLQLSAWLADSAKTAALIADNPDLILASWLINDVRLGQCDLPTAISRLQQLITWRDTNLPNADLLLRIPNPMLTQDVLSLHYVQDSIGTINPAGAAQSYSKLIRDAYLAIKGYGYAHVDVFDQQSEIFGTVSRFSHPLMADQLHPSSGGDPYFPTSGGYVAIADRVASYVGHQGSTSGWTTDRLAYGSSEEFLCNGGATGTLDLAPYGNGPKPAQWPIDANCSVLVEGTNTPIALTSATITRPFATNNVRLTSLPSPASTVDWTLYLNRRARVVNTTPGRGPTTSDRQVLATVTVPAITAATQFGEITGVTVPGARTGAVHDATAILCTPSATLDAAGIRVIGCQASANDTVRIQLRNASGSDYAGASNQTFTFWVVR